MRHATIKSGLRGASLLFALIDFVRLLFFHVNRLDDMGWVSDSH